MDNLEIKIVRSSDSAKFEMGAFHDWMIAEDGLEGFGDISNNIEYVDNIAQDGGILDSSHVGKKDRTINCFYRYQSNMDIARKTALSFFNAKDTYKVIVTYGTREVFAEGQLLKLVAMPRHLKKGYVSLAITFLFGSSYWKSIDDFGYNIAAVRGMIAFPYLATTEPSNIGLTGGVYNFARQIVIYNDGDAETRCKAIITASGDVVNPKLIINNQYVRVLDTLVNGDVIEMDFAAIPPTVKKNGSNFLGHCDRTSAFTKMIIERGDNTISYDADNGTTNLSVNVYYNKRYGAI